MIVPAILHLCCHFGVLPDLSAEIENLFQLIKLHDDAKFLIIFINLCNVRKFVTDLFSRQYLRNPIFRDAVIKILCLGKCFKLLIKETYGLGEHDESSREVNSIKFSDENVFLESDNMVILKRHYTNCYLKLSKVLVDYLEDLMT
jgi:hypothetical protein